MKKYRIREITDLDILYIHKLYRETILTVNLKDYTLKEVEDWASCGDNLTRWEQLIKDHSFILAEDNNGFMVGFGSINNVGYIHTLFVHKDFQRQGIASLLYVYLENFARDKGVDRLFSEVSITAKPFFEKQGFHEDEQQKRQANKLCLVNYKMSKKLTQ